MAICLSIPLLLLLLINFSLSSLANSSAANACEAEQFNKMPCRCCKMSCWYDVAKSVTHELGHVPGQEGEDEALATLRLIRACMIAECTPLCASMGPTKKHRFPSMAEPVT